MYANLSKQRNKQINDYYKRFKHQYSLTHRNNYLAAINCQYCKSIHYSTADYKQLFYISEYSIWGQWQRFCKCSITVNP